MIVVQVSQKNLARKNLTSTLTPDYAFCVYRGRAGRLLHYLGMLTPVALTPCNLLPHVVAGGSMSVNHRKKSGRLRRIFNTADEFVERTDILLSKSKPAVINLFLFIHLIIDLIVVLVVLWHRSG